MKSEECCLTALFTYGFLAWVSRPSEWLLILSHMVFIAWWRIFYLAIYLLLRLLRFRIFPMCHFYIVLYFPINQFSILCIWCHVVFFPIISTAFVCLNSLSSISFHLNVAHILCCSYKSCSCSLEYLSQYSVFIFLNFLLKMFHFPG